MAIRVKTNKHKQMGKARKVKHMGEWCAYDILSYYILMCFFGNYCVYEILKD